MEGQDQGPQWIVAVCSVVFDVDVGQRVEHIYPEGVLSDDEVQDVAFHAFPVRAGGSHSWQAASALVGGQRQRECCSVLGRQSRRPSY